MRRQSAVSIYTTHVTQVDDGVDKEKMPIIVYQNITIDCVENVVTTIGIVFAIIIRTKSKTQKLLVYLLSCSKASFRNIWLSQYSTDFSILIFCKTYHTIRTGLKIFIMSLYAFKERCKIVI